MLVAPGEAPGYFAETQAYDTEPLSLSEILRLDLHLGAGEEERAVKRSQQMTRSRGIAQTKEHVKWEKKDVVTKGVYKPWFFSRFARFWIPLGKPQCALDLKSISSAARSQSHRQPRNGKECDDDSSDKSGREEEVWVGCDGCSKWRKVPHGFSFDKSKSFFCHMLRDTTCVTPEEEWDDQEEFVDDADRVVDECGSSSTTPRNTHTNYCSQHHAQPQHDCGHPRRMSSCSSTERAAGKRKLVSPRAFGAHDRDDVSERWKRSRRTPIHDHDSCRDSLSRSPDEAPSQKPHRVGQTGVGGGLGMSRLDAVVRVLKATGKALHYDVITRQALQQGIIRFTGSQGTAGESMKAFLNKTIRENKSAAIMNMGKGVYGLKEWGRSGQSKEQQASPDALPGGASSKTSAAGVAPCSLPSRPLCSTLTI
jgi:hypothetical protein